MANVVYSYFNCQTYTMNRAIITFINKAIKARIHKVRSLPLAVNKLEYAKQLVYKITVIDIKANDLNVDEIKYLKDEKFKILFDEFYKKINSCEQLNFTKETFKSFVNELINLVHLKGKDFYMPIRIKLTHKMHGIELYNIITILGKEETSKRLISGLIY